MEELIDRQYQGNEEEQESLVEKYMAEAQKEDKARLQKVLLGEFARKRTREEAGLDDSNFLSAEERVHSDDYRNVDEADAGEAKGHRRPRTRNIQHRHHGNK